MRLSIFSREGSGTPLQYFCLENPMDGGAWWATVHGVARVGHDWSDLAAAAAASFHLFMDHHIFFPGRFLVHDFAQFYIAVFEKLILFLLGYELLGEFSKYLLSQFLVLSCAYIKISKLDKLLPQFALKLT